ncbi:MAG: hypothetical protein RRY25_09580, partial [Anaerovorax sp.]
AKPCPVWDETFLSDQETLFFALDEIKTADLKPEAPKPTEDDKFVPGMTKMSYGVGSFNADMSTYAGKSISSHVVVYTCGLKKEYKEDMTLSKNVGDYRLDTVYKYKNTKTPCYYTMSGGKITTMVLPTDVGFSGRIYGVINGSITTVNGDKESVVGFETLTALKPITWLGAKKLTPPTNTLDGTIFELNASDGEIQSIYKSTDTQKSGKVFEEISGTAWVPVEKYTDTVVTTSQGGVLFAVKPNAAVYELSDDG